jgi:hypothetical protein
MDASFFEQLLYEEESPLLDFKRDQYRFVGAQDEEKSEILKDLLGFANAWRRAAAYILVGVEDVRGGRGDVVGIGAHLDDHSLQQFVNSLTNRPLLFHYEAFGSQGKQVGVIRIEEQTRPIYLTRDFGKLKKNDVYVRRGTSTDPTKPATPDEIAQMGQGASQQSAELGVGFADVASDAGLGVHIAWEADYCEMPLQNTIPNLEERPTTNSPGDFARSSMLALTHQINHGYYRELARYETANRLFRPVRLIVTNGPTAASSVRIEVTVPTGGGTQVMYSSDLPDPPQRYFDRLGFQTQRRVVPRLRKLPGGVLIDRNDDRVRIEIDCGNLQPGRKVWSDVFLLGITRTGDTALTGQIFSDNLPQPKDFTLKISTNIRTSCMAVGDLKAIRRPSVPVYQDGI